MGVQKFVESVQYPDVREISHRKEMTKAAFKAPPELLAALQAKGMSTFPSTEGDPHGIGDPTPVKDFTDRRGEISFNSRLQVYPDTFLLPPAFRSDGQPPEAKLRRDPPAHPDNASEVLAAEQKEKRARELEEQGRVMLLAERRAIEATEENDENVTKTTEGTHMHPWLQRMTVGEYPAPEVSYARRVAKGEAAESIEKDRDKLRLAMDVCWNQLPPSWVLCVPSLRGAFLRHVDFGAAPVTPLVDSWRDIFGQARTPLLRRYWMIRRRYGVVVGSI